MFDKAYNMTTDNPVTTPEKKSPKPKKKIYKNPIIWILIIILIIILLFLYLNPLNNSFINDVKKSIFSVIIDQEFVDKVDECIYNCLCPCYCICEDDCSEFLSIYHASGCPKEIMQKAFPIN